VCVKYPTHLTAVVEWAFLSDLDIPLLACFILSRKAYLIKTCILAKYPILCVILELYVKRLGIDGRIILR
jgi:hypothetical protein